jgi:hypothetical protein
LAFFDIRHPFGGGILSWKEVEFRNFIRLV